MTAASCVSFFINSIGVLKNQDKPSIVKIHPIMCPPWISKEQICHREYFHCTTLHRQNILCNTILWIALYQQSQRKTKNRNPLSWQHSIFHQMLHVPLSPSWRSSIWHSHHHVWISEDGYQSVTMNQSGYLVLCPVIVWVTVVSITLSYHVTNAKAIVNTIIINNVLKTMLSVTIWEKLWSAARIIGRDNLEFDPNDIGAHSILYGAAMMMYLVQLATFFIIMIGRWLSEAFL